MDWTIYLDYQSSLGAIEVHDESINCVLPPELETRNLSASETLP